MAHSEVDDIEAEVRDLTSRGVTFEEYETPKTVNFIAEVDPARGAWFKDPDGNMLGVRQGTKVHHHIRDAFFLFELALAINLETVESVDREGLRLGLLTYQMRCLELEGEIPNTASTPMPVGPWRSAGRSGAKPSRLS